MFVDVNRRRDDFEHTDGEVRSRRGVVRTHTMRDAPIFARPLTLADLEKRLQALYDPYYRTLERLLAELRRSEEHTSELQSQSNLVCRLLLEKKNNKHSRPHH